MEVILLEKIRNLGNMGDKVLVKPGYGRNYLIPQGKALSATAKNLEEFEKRRAELEKKSEANLADAKKHAEALSELTIKISARASEDGKLFGSVGTREIAQAIVDAGVEVHKSEIRLPEGALRYVGEYQVEIQFHSDVVTTAKILIVAEE